MLGHMKKRPIRHKPKKLSSRSSNFLLSDKGELLKVPRSLVEEYRAYIVTDCTSVEKAKVKFQKILTVSSEEAFLGINEKYTKGGALLKAVRLREAMTQKEFSKMIDVTQGDLSKMEHGRRTIGKEIAGRIAKKFDVNYRWFL